MQGDTFFYVFAKLGAERFEAAHAAGAKLELEDALAPNLARAPVFHSNIRTPALSQELARDFNAVDPRVQCRGAGYSAILRGR